MALLIRRSFARCYQSQGLLRNASGFVGRQIAEVQVVSLPVSLRFLHSHRRCTSPMLSTRYFYNVYGGSAMPLSVYSNEIMIGSRHFTTSSQQLQAPNQGDEEQNLRKRPQAQVVNEGPIIYQGQLNTMIKIIKLFSLSSSAIGCVLVPTILYQSTSVINLIVASFASLTILTPLAIHWFTKGYVTQMYFNRDEDTYTALTYTFLLRTKRLQFTPDDVEVPAVQNLFSSILAKGMPLLIDDSKFANPNDLMHLKGYDKQLGNLSLDEIKKLYEQEEGIQKQ